MRGAWFDQMYTVLSIHQHDSMISIAWRKVISQVHSDELFFKQALLHIIFLLIYIWDPVCLRTPKSGDFDLCCV
jgi:hypothetical protein